MKRTPALFALALALTVACGDTVSDVPGSDVDAGLDSGGKVGSDASTGNDGAAKTDGAAGECGTCPSGYTCGSANGKAVCRSGAGIPLFEHVYVVLMENTSLDTLDKATNTPNLKRMASTGASGKNYHGVTHPSLPNYIALVTGDTQGIGCDCKAAPGQGTCSAVSCNRVLSNCTCAAPMTTIADQLETAKKGWKAYAEGMGTACNVQNAGKYAVRHVPFLYDTKIQNDATRCANVVDLGAFDPDTAPAFSFIAPDLEHDMHDPFPGGAQNLANGDGFIGPLVDRIVASAAYKKSGLLVVVWDEDDASGGITGTDDPIPMFVMSPFAKSGGFASSLKMDHYTLLATLEDGLALPRLGKAATARAGFEPTLVDFFPDK